MLAMLIKKGLKLAAKELITSGATSAGTRVGEALGGLIADRIRPKKPDDEKETKKP